ncbi:hypothetical protein F4212_01390 [Candidatus Poribacteria bacterium]|nr:hypothetical protein [Candidatus Poribacteria bacterium]
MASELAALPAPDVLETLDFDIIFSALLTEFLARNPNYSSIVEGDPAYSILQAMAWQEVMTRKRINDAARAVLATHAVGSDLDNIAVLFGITRNVIVEGDPNADPPIAEELETDRHLRDRILNALEAVAPGSREWYRRYALDASVDVQDARAVRTADGEITVYVQANNVTAVPSQTLLTAVENYLNHDDRRFLCDSLVVSAVGIESYALTAEITPVVGLDGNTVLADIQKRANEFVEQRKIIGRDIPLSHIYAALITDAVSEISLASPTANIVPQTGLETTPLVPEVPVASAVSITLA